MNLSYKRILPLLLILALSFTVRALTANFMRAHLNDAGWFQWGSFAVFDGQAQNVLDGKESFFWIPDASRTDLMQYPPGFRLWMATIYRLTGNRSAVSVLWVHMAIDSLAVFLVVGIGAVSYGWTVGLVSGTLAALSPLLALSGVTPSADAPTSWLVLAGVLFLALAARKRSIYFACTAGAFLGLASWMRVNPLLLFVPWSIALFLILPATRRQRLAMSLGIVLVTLLVISPVVIRNLVVFYPEVAPTGLNVGWNLLAGIGETERGVEFGAPCCDELAARRTARINVSGWNSSRSRARPPRAGHYQESPNLVCGRNGQAHLGASEIRRKTVAVSRQRRHQRHCAKDSA